jgi:predicted MFS family arabinose efflux permease
MVYALFGLLDAVFFFMPFIIMLLIKLVLGVAGSNSANIRVSSINHYIEDDRRGRLNAIYQTMINLAILLGRFVAGWLGEYFHYATIGIFYSILIFIGIWLFILQKKMHVKALYNQAV